MAPHKPQTAASTQTAAITKTMACPMRRLTASWRTSPTAIEPTNASAVRRRPNRLANDCNRQHLRHRPISLPMTSLESHRSRSGHGRRKWSITSSKWRVQMHKPDSRVLAKTKGYTTGIWSTRGLELLFPDPYMEDGVTSTVDHVAPWCHHRSPDPGSVGGVDRGMKGCPPEGRQAGARCLTAATAWPRPVLASRATSGGVHSSRHHHRSDHGDLVCNQPGQRTASNRIGAVRRSNRHGRIARTDCPRSVDRMAEGLSAGL